MIINRIALFFAFVFGFASTQAPEFWQQYQQRLGGAIDELSAIVGQFDAEAGAQHLNEAQAVARLEAEPDPLARFKGLFMASFDAIEHRHAQVVIYQDEAKRLGVLPQFAFVDERNRQQRKMWVDVLKQGMAEGVFRSDLNVDLVYRFIRDTTWVSVRWYQPGGKLTAEDVGQHYLTIVLGGVAVTP